MAQNEAKRRLIIQSSYKYCEDRNGPNLAHGKKERAAWSRKVIYRDERRRERAREGLDGEKR